MDYREALDKSILESIKNRIYKFLQKKGIASAELIKQNMDALSGLYVENSIENGGPRMESRGAKGNRPSEIMIDKGFVELDKNGKPIGIDSYIARLIQSQLGHELLHTGTRYDGYTGIMNNKYNRGLNEGLTQMITEKIFGYVVSPNTDSNYKNFKKIAKILDVTFGEDVTLDSYFNHTDALENSCNTLSRDNYFYRNLNDCLTYIYYMKTNTKEKDASYNNLINPLKDKMSDLALQKVCAQIIIPKLKNLPKEEQKKYLVNILSEVSDDQEVSQQLRDTLTNFVSMSVEHLEEEKSRINKEIKTVETKHKFVEQLYTEKDYSKLVTVNDDGKVFLVSNPKVEIRNEAMLEKIFAHMYFQEKNYTSEQFKNYSERVASKCENVDKNNTVIFSDTIKSSVLEKKKTLASIKYLARENGYAVLNPLSECEQSDKISLNAIKKARENEPLSFQDLRKVYESYTIAYENDVNNKWKMVVKNRETGEKTDDVAISKIAKFASVWAEATGIKWMADEKISGITYAFNEQSEQVFNQVGELVSKNMMETGTIDTKAIYDEISEGKYKYSETIIDTLLANPVKLKIIYDFYKMQNPQSKLEVKLSKTSREFINGIDVNKMLESQVDDIVSAIPQNEGNETIVEVDDDSGSSGWATMTHGQTMVGSKEQDENNSRSKAFYESLQSSNDISEEAKESKRRSFRETIQSTNRTEPESREEQVKRSKSFFESLRKSNVTSSEVKNVAGEIEEIQRQKALSFKKSVGTLTPEEELLLENLNKKYGAIEKDNNKKSHDNKKQNGMSI